MLYVTTRNKYDAYTVTRAIQNDRGPDGGFYLPFQMPKLQREDILCLKEESFGEAVARILNLFFPCRLSGADVDFAVGKYPIKLQSINPRVVTAETWHNLDWDFSGVEKSLNARISGNADRSVKPSGWVRIAVRIAVLFGIYGIMMKNGDITADKRLDIALPAEDFTLPMAAWYARKIGLPVGNIVCGCGDDSALWNLINFGEMKTDGAGVPENIERLIFGTNGIEEALHFRDCCQKGRGYTLPALSLERLRQGLFAAVVSTQRLTSVIPNVYDTSGYILDPDTALAYGAMQDYRAQTGQSQTMLLISERSPLLEADTVAGALNISLETLKERLEKQ